jgi:hypothetical protein
MAVPPRFVRFHERLTQLANYNKGQHAAVEDNLQVEHIQSNKVASNPPSQKFLNRMAEMFACNDSGKLADHVTATVFVRVHRNVPKVYVAKNRGRSEEDKTMASAMQIFLRACAQSSEDSAANDGFRRHLLWYNRHRLARYMNEVRDLSVCEYASLFVDARDVLLAKSLREIVSKSHQPIPSRNATALSN